MAEQRTPTSPPAAGRRRRLVLLAALLVLVIGGIAAVVAAVVGAGAASTASLVPTLPPATPAPTASAPPTASAAPTDSPTSPTDPAVAVFLGDSYTQGWGASNPTMKWTTVVAYAAGWTEVNEGQGGTGYVTMAGVASCGQDDCPAYPDRVADIVAAAPDVVVIAGGQNDRWALATDPELVQAAVDRTFSLLREGLPNARLIAVGPSTAEPATAMITDLDGWVRAAADRVDAEYVSLLDPVVIQSDMVVSDGVHVNDAGHRAIADRVLDTVLTRAD
ncbi:MULTISPECIES: SGNH/GDSL hydrolase family protein [unclassified Cryobacterium]|uniref:SGNH/GDSL hydrolase family protein n=1 Tax=unclassified Cryobacterium TaxID=2649013 RepID=UPI0010690EF7|nr:MULTISPECIES: SGNH/GDSL hydrolase family protein [unclassified Cryobacterium]TFC59474.1 SGNH/GDSL hydrolase family protein [Cryobacterium sp. TMB3-1-2]TFC67270.1 SGNH/GDSL hydrolase family protein [Cryobacterium sp. TMB3-15]TFC73217.1 SGNH/GDSL hydrolase family protein [Cryobacterium sp. TMB3-10]TFD46105.1 SGNH/GDSL hydrolase family protein [Cryobacterium sp. TMB3-12]